MTPDTERAAIQREKSEGLIFCCETAMGWGLDFDRLLALLAAEAELADAWAAVRDEAAQTCVEIELRKAAEARVRELEDALAGEQEAVLFLRGELARAKSAAVLAGEATEQ